MENYILFVCRSNTGRSQMAQAFFNFYNRNESIRAVSAGLKPGGAVSEKVIAVMEELGLDMTDASVYYPKGLDSIDPTVKEKISTVYAIDCDLDKYKFKMLVSLKVDTLDEMDMESIRKVRDDIKLSVLEIIKKRYLREPRRCMFA